MSELSHEYTVAEPVQQPTRYFKVYDELSDEQRERRRAYMREYRLKHPDKYKKAQAKYFASMPDVKAYRAKVYRESATQHKLINCECGSSVKHHSMKQHLQTKKHINATQHQ